MVCPGNGYDDEEDAFLADEEEEELEEDKDEEIVDEVIEDDELVEREPILTTLNPDDVLRIKAVLDDADISYHFDGDIKTTKKTYIKPAQLFVDPDQIEEARELIDDLDLTYMSLGSEEDPIEYVDFEEDDYDEQ